MDLPSICALSNLVAEWLMKDGGVADHHPPSNHSTPTWISADCRSFKNSICMIQVSANR
jgi:hypothetical protein